MDRLDELAIFVAIVERASLVGAARKLRRSPPVVTRALATLEDRAGTRLIERTTRRLSPTEAGRDLAERARTILGAYDAALLGTAGTPVRGLLRITAPVQFGRKHVAPLVSDFLDRFAETQIELVLNDRNLDLIDDALDIAVRIGHLSDSALLARRVGAVSSIVVASPAYLKRRGHPARPQDLIGHDTIVGTSRATIREWRFGPASASTAVRLAPRLLVNEVEAQILAVRAGRGIARLLSYQVADDLAAGTLIRLLTAFEAPPVPVQLVARGGSHMTPKVRAFLDHASAALRALPVLQQIRPRDDAAHAS